MDDLYSLIPVIKRARGFRLYAFSGRRYLDLWLGGGHNFLGHKPPQFVNHLKQAAERGAVAELPSIYSRRLANALRSLFPDYSSFLVAPTLPELFEAASRALGRPFSPADVSDPLLPEKTKEAAAVSVWRPFCPANVMGDLLLPIVPSGLGTTPFVLCSRRPLPEVPAPPVSALVLAAAARRLNLLKECELPVWYRPDLFAASPRFAQHGVYLVPRCAAADYPAVFRRCLEAGLVLSPSFSEPSILPLELSFGELGLLHKAFC
jgi:hypothetical protein